jgi:hypothetical protein
MTETVRTKQWNCHDNWLEDSITGRLNPSPRLIKFSKSLSSLLLCFTSLHVMSNTGTLYAVNDREWWKLSWPICNKIFIILMYLRVSYVWEIS